jgi:hypothetical protein
LLIRGPIAATLFLLACQEPTGEHAESITNAMNDDGDPGVAALMQGQTLVCTATLVAPRVLLTAAHCLQSDTPPDAFFGAAPDQGGTRIAIVDVHRHPQFDPSILVNDIALVLLHDPAPGTPWPLPTTPLAQGATLRLVGFGRTGATDSTPPRKRQGTAILGTLNASDFYFAPSPSQTCEGDSGGPAFATVNNVEVVVGVTSSGDPMCTMNARDIRVDAYAGAFILPYLAATAEGAAGAGARCFYPAQCAGGAPCTPALDDPRLSFCSPACNAGCPSGLTCVEGLCRHPTPSPGAMGAACSDASQCLDGACAARAGASMPLCTRTCFTDIPGFCPSGYACVATQSGGDACFATPSDSGCGVGGSGSPSTWLLLLLFAWRRRRFHRD